MVQSTPPKRGEATFRSGFRLKNRFGGVGLLFAALLAVLILLASTWAIERKVTDDTRRALENELQTVLTAVEESLHRWHAEREGDANVWAQNNELRGYVLELLKQGMSGETLAASPAQKGLRELLAPVLKERGYKGYFVVSRLGMNIGSTRDNNLGVPSLFLTEKSGFFFRVLLGNPATSVPQPSDVPLTTLDGKVLNAYPTMFTGAPILDSEGDVIAVIAFRIDPMQDFTSILKLGNIGKTGETYAFDETGLLISDTRFAEEARKAGLLNADASAILNIEIRDPGGNMLEGFVPDVPRRMQPLTVMADNAILGERTVHLGGYRNFMGKPVVGVWLWHEETNFGIATELGRDEAYRLLDSLRQVMYLMGGLACFLLLGMTGLFLNNRRQLLVKENSLRSVIDNMVDGVITIDAKGTIDRFNPAAENIFGYERSEVIGKNVRMLMPEPYTSEHDSYLSNYMQTGEKKIIGSGREVEGLRKDGSIFPLELAVSDMGVEERQMFVGMVRDITGRKLAEAKVQQAQDRLVNAIESINEGFVLHDANDRLILSNSRYREFYASNSEALKPGSTFEDFVRSNVERGLFPESKGREEEFIAERLGERKANLGPVERQLADGRWLLLSDKQTKHGERVGIRTDISEIKHREQELQQREEQFSKAFHASPVMTALIEMETSEHLITDVNETWLDTLGYTRDEIVGKSPKKLNIWFDPENRTAFYELIERVGVARNYPAQFRTKDGDIREVLLFGDKVEINDVDHLLTAIMDVTEQKRVETMKSEFISTVNHELRTPLTSIQGALALINKADPEGLEDKFKNLINIAHRNAGRLVRLINDILDIDKIEAGKMTLKLSVHDLNELLRVGVESNQAYADQYSVNLVVRDTPETASVHVDPDRIAQVFANLCSNAAKYSHENGTVDLSITHEGGSFRVGVSDHGDGIPAEFRERIFGKFAQADSSVTRKREGTGLGLAITKAIVEMHGGQIGFDSVVGKGSTFWFELPEFELIEVASNDVDEKETESQFRVLVCEDDPDIAEVLSQILEADGMACDVAMTASDCKRLLKSRTYSAMTLDLILPDQDGISLIHEIRSNKETAALPIVVVSARAEEGRVEMNGDAVGIFDWLQKPIDREGLVAALSQVKKAEGQEHFRVLHVEDDHELVEVIQNFLFNVAEVDGAGTLEIARQKLLQNTYDVVLLDVGLPDGNGLDLIPSLKTSEGKPIPVILFTAQDVPAEIAQKVDQVLTKSRSSVDNLVAAVKGVIGNKASDTDIKE